LFSTTPRNPTDLNSPGVLTEKIGEIMFCEEVHFYSTLPMGRFVLLEIQCLV